MAGPMPGLLSLVEELYGRVNKDRLFGTGVRGAAIRGLLGADPPADATGKEMDAYRNFSNAAMALAAGPVAATRAMRGAKTLKNAPQAEALETARQNAVKMLGLPETNTAMDRARAMGFDTEAFHGTTADIRMFLPEFRGEATGAQSAKKAYFLAADPLNPPAQMLTKAPANSESVQMLRNLGIPETEISKLNQVSMKGHGAETASGYAQIGGSRDYKEAMRKANAEEKAGNWGEYEKWMKIAEDAEIGRNQYLQGLVAKYGDARDTMLAKINDSILSKKLPQDQAVALDAKMKQLMPYGWYNSYSIPQLKALKGELAKLSDAPEGALKSIDDFISVKAERQLAENTQQGSNVMPLMVRSQNPMNYDFGGGAYREQSYADLIDKAANAKSDVLFLRNTFDPGAGPAKLVDVLAVRDPSRIRSRFAAFDPARIDDKDLLASLAAMGITLPLTMGLLSDQTD
jgi:hypothetical protein